MKLRDVLPKEALSGEYEGSKFLIGAKAVCLNQRFGE